MYYLENTPKTPLERGIKSNSSFITHNSFRYFKKLLNFLLLPFSLPAGHRITVSLLH